MTRSRNRTPSNAISAAGLGASLGAVIEIAALIFGHPLPPGTAAPLAGALATILAYCAQGGRRGEAD